jgi:Tim44-like domain
MPTSRDRRLLARVTSFTLLVLLTAPASAFGLAGGATGSGGGGGGGGGGGSSSGGSYGGSGSGSGGDWPWWGWVLFVAVLVGPWLLVALVPAWRAAAKRFYRNKIRRRGQKVEKAAGAANLDDGYWDPADLKKRVQEAFFPIQLSWEKRSVEDSRPYVSDALYERHRLQLEGLEKQNRVNRIADLKLHTVDIVRIYNVTDDGEDRFVANITCEARDWMEDTQTQKMINGNKTSTTQFEQYWSFSRHPEHGWVLDEIQQGEEARYHLDADIVSNDEGPRIDEPGNGAPAAGPAFGDGAAAGTPAPGAKT